MSSRDDVRNAVDAAVDSVLARLREDLVDRVVSHLPEPPPPPPPPAAHAASDDVHLGPLRGEVFALLDGSGQVEILNRLMDSLAAWWSRSVLYLVKPGAYQPWDARGFDAGLGNAAVKGAAIPEHAETILDASLTGSGTQSGNHLLEAKLGPHEGTRAAVPIGIRNKAAAILYVDGPKLGEDASVAALEMLARVAANAIELGMVAKRTPPFVRAEAAIAPTAAAAAAAPAPAPKPVPKPAPAPIPVAVPAPAPVAAPAPPPPAPQPPPPAPPPPRAVPVAVPDVEIEVEVEMDEPAPPPATPPPSFAMPAAPPAPAPRFAPPAPPAAAAPAPTFTPPAPPAAAAPAPTFTPPALPAAAAPAPTFTPPAPPAPAAAAPPARAAALAEPAHEGTLDPRELLKGGAKPVVDAGQATPATRTFSRWKPVRDQMKSAEEADPTLAGIPEADRPKHVEARKIARLLVSDIKLYHEAKVAVGRKNKDLYERLKDEIEKSRSNYNDRVDRQVAASTSYFRDEMVATLADGDASAFGPGFR